MGKKVKEEKKIEEPKVYSKIEKQIHNLEYQLAVLKGKK